MKVHFLSDNEKKKRIAIHFLGIGGSGASAAASLAKAEGFEISGCDLNPHNEFTESFGKHLLSAGHSPSHISSGNSNIDMLIITPAILSQDPKNTELLEAKKEDVPILTWQQFLGKYLAKDKFIIAICGTHGKSTTTAMISLMLEAAGLDPSVVLGAIIPKLGTNFRVGESKYLVVEADEFNDNFLSLTPDVCVVTNIEMDHPEYFKDFESLKASFTKFLTSTKQTVVANLTDRGVVDVLKVVMKQSSVTSVDFSKNEMALNLKIPGEFNILNAKAAMQVGILLGIDPQIIKASLENYTGISRRFEYLGELKGAAVYSDFGHHPTEIKVTLEALRKKFPNKKIWVIFQPHMFSRTKALFDDFVEAFKNAVDPDLIGVDGVAILDIYPSREVDTGLVNSKQLAEKIHEKKVEYSNWGEIKKWLKTYQPKNDIFFFMGAGDIDKMARELVNLQD